MAVLQVGLEESLPAHGKHLVAILPLKQPDQGRSAIYLARDRLHVCVSRRPPFLERQGSCDVIRRAEASAPTTS
jgi:DNA-binding transcriptional LysR family regulator